VNVKVLARLVNSGGSEDDRRETATRAGFSPKTAGVQGSRLLKTVKVVTNFPSFAIFLCLLLVGCQERQQEAAAAPAISYKTRAEHATAKVEKEYRLSETETIKVVIVPGFPMGDRCVIYTNVQGSTMQCREITPGQQ
jgi:hypothetical protein